MRVGVARGGDKHAPMPYQRGRSRPVTATAPHPRQGCDFPRPNPGSPGAPDSTRPVGIGLAWRAQILSHQARPVAWILSKYNSRAATRRPLVVRALARQARPDFGSPGETKSGLGNYPRKPKDPEPEIHKIPSQWTTKSGTGGHVSYEPSHGISWEESFSPAAGQDTDMAVSAQPQSKPTFSHASAAVPVGEGWWYRRG